MMILTLGLLPALMSSWFALSTEINCVSFPS
jgi:hypothetical protein